MAVPLQAPYTMSKHAVLALTECLHLEVQTASMATTLTSRPCYPAPWVSNIFESAGEADAGGDSGTAESQRTAMLDVKATAMDPLAAAETLFEQAAEGRFYLVNQDSVLSAMQRRAEVLAAQSHPSVR